MFTAFPASAPPSSISRRQVHARETAASFSALPVTIKCRLICVNRRGASSRRSRSASLRNWSRRDDLLQNGDHIDRTATARRHQHHLIGLGALSPELPSIRIWCPDADSPIKVNPSTHFTRACIKFNSSIAIFLSDYAHITILATEGDLRHAEARQRHAAKAMLKQSGCYSNIDVLHVCRGVHIRLSKIISQLPCIGKQHD
ncbi:hypothetical protein BANRA_00001 [Klebsiella pneumoniae]|nr:hypothetical protein BANRA_00001 [Klebsiella pneumoniae]